ncbi:InlB B-repeat-containing protein [Paenibacillus ferrarius]|uniref:InlB B-repeat-containing protein n=1 Tax=Paenibacillus ferrarius TaxID=1469647 RepID=UPI003CC5394C
MAKDTLSVNVSYAYESGEGSHAEGATVAIHAGSRSNYTFSSRSPTEGVIFANANSTSTNFTMSAKNVTVTATWRYSNSGGTTIFRFVRQYTANHA